jgi:hypothetical protein
MLLSPLALPPSPTMVAASGSFVVIYPPLQNGNLITVEGYVGFQCPPGQPNQYHVQVVWEHGGVVVFQNNNAELPPLKNMTGGHYEYNFSDTRTLNSGGEWIVRVRLYHQQPPGNDNQAEACAIIIIETFTITVTTEPEGLNITVDGTTYVSPKTFTWLKGSVHGIGTSSPQLNGGTRYTWVSWSDGGDINHSVSATGNITYTAYFKTQYLVSFTQAGSGIAPTVTYSIDGGTPVTDTVPFSIWVDSGSSISYTYENIVYDGAGTRYILTGVSPSQPQTVNSPLTITGTYNTQYYLTVNTDPTEVLTLNPAAVSGEGWYDAGTTATVDAVQIVDEIAGESRYDFRSWTGATPTGIGNKAEVLMDCPKTAIANYRLQYKITFAQSGVGTDFTGTVLTIDGANYGLSDTNVLPAEFWWDKDSTHSFAFQSPLSVGTDKQYVWTSTSGLSTLQSDSSFTVTASGSITADYRTQYLVSFTQTGVGSDFTGIVMTVNSVDYDRGGHAAWYDAGVSIVFNYKSPLVVAFNQKQYVLTGVDASSPLTVSGPVTVTGSYKTQYYLTVVSDHGTTGGEGWYDSGTTAYATVSPLVVAGPAGVQYVFTHWSGDASGATSPSSPITMDAPKTALANWKTQYCITFSQNGLDETVVGTVVTVGGSAKTYGDLPFTIWVDSGSPVSYSYEAFVSSSVSGERFRLDSITGPASPIVATGPATVTGNYKAQYYINVLSAHGSPTASGWVDEGGSFTASVTSPAEVVANDHQWVCTGFTVDENPVQEGTSHTFTNVQAPHTIVFYWKQQFWIQVNSAYGSPTPSQWVDQGGSLTVSVTSPAGESEDVRYRCTGYTLDVNPPVEDGSTSYAFNDVQSPHVITFNWITQYRVTFYTIPAYGTITAGGVVRSNGESAFYDEGASVTIVSNAPAGYLFSSWTVTGGVTVDDYTSQTTIMNVGGAGSLTANFVSNTVSITITSSPVTGGGFVRVDGVPHATPVTFTWVIGSTHVLEAASTVPGPTGTRYVWTGWSDGGAQTHVYTVPGVHVIVTAYFSVQHYLNVVSLHDTPGGSGWYDEGSTAYATLETGNVVEGGVQYVFTGWSGDASGTGLTSNPIIMNRPKTAVANWEAGLYTVTFDKSPRQGIITVDGTVYTSLPVVLRWVPGSFHEVVVPLIEEEPGGTRYVFRSWSDGSRLASRTITADKPGAVYIAYYDVQYRLTVYSEHGATTGSGWYDDGAEAVFSVSPGVVRDEAEGVEYTFKGWVGSGAATCYTGPDNPAKVVMTGPIEEFAQWEPTMYYLNVVSEYGDPYGSGWYPPNSEARFGVNTPVNHGNGTLRVFLDWSGDLSLREPVGTIVMVKPHTVIASWDTQYLVVYNTTAPNGVLLSIPRVPQTLSPGFNVFVAYYSAGSSVEVGPAPEIIYEAEGVRYCFEGWAIDGKPATSGVNLTFTVDKPLNISVIYGTEMLLTVNVVGVSQPYTARLTVESSPAQVFDITPTSPFEQWVRKGVDVTLSVSSPNKIGQGEWAVFREWSGDAQGEQRTVSLRVLDPLNVNAVFFAANPVAESIPYSLLTGIVSTVFSRLIRRRRGEEHQAGRRYSPTLGITSLMVVLAAAAIVSSCVAVRYGINIWELPDFTNWAVVFTAVEAVFFLAATLLATRLAIPRKVDIPAIYPNPYGI